MASWLCFIGCGGNRIGIVRPRIVATYYPVDWPPVFYTFLCAVSFEHFSKFIPLLPVAWDVLAFFSVLEAAQTFIPFLQPLDEILVSAISARTVLEVEMSLTLA